MSSVSVSDRSFKAFNQRQISDAQVKRVEEIKEAACVLWDLVDGISAIPGNSEAGRLISLAKTELENTVMWATKAVSRQ